MKKRAKILLAAAIILLAALSFWLWPRPLTATHYEIDTEVTAPVRIVQLTDLHGRQFGENNAQLVELISEQNPDMIFMTGDMFDYDDADLTVINALISALSDVASVYYSYGNHEAEWMNTFTADLKAVLSAAGATVLDTEYVDTTVNGQQLRIGGYYGYYRTPHMETHDEAEQADKIAFADDFENTDRQKLLLCHIPTGWLDWNQIDKCNAGVVFCGHYHGGLIRLPVIDRGVYAPYVGWFPQYTKGVFAGKCAICVLSAGMDSGVSIPRIYNAPEIVVVDLK